MEKVIGILSWLFMESMLLPYAIIVIELSIYYSRQNQWPFLIFKAVKPWYCQQLISSTDTHCRSIVKLCRDIIDRSCMVEAIMIGNNNIQMLIVDMKYI